MKKVNILFLSLVSLFIISSCKGIENNDRFWGESEIYDDFWWKDYEPVRMEQTLLIEFNEDAELFGNSWSQKIEFDVVDAVTKARFEHIKLYKNGNLCDDNILVITPEDKEVIVGIEFLKSAPEGNHVLTLVERGRSGLDRIEVDFGEGVVVAKDTVANPLKVLVSWIGAFIFAVIVVIALIGRASNPKIKFVVRTVEPIMMVLSKKNEARVLMLTNDRRKKQNFFNLLFKGKTKYVYIDTLNADIMLTAARRGVKLKSSYVATPFAVIMEKTQNAGVYTLTNGNSKIKIQIS